MRNLGLAFRRRFKRLWNQWLPGVPLPIRLSRGIWWLAINDVNSDGVFAGDFESNERRFVERFLKEGMTVLDIGAHHGFYTLLASKRVGPSGRVLAFEPSSRERQRLLLHLKVNRSRNVTVEPLALAEKEGQADLYVVQGRDTGCNSLRPPAVAEPTVPLDVNTTTLDHYLEKAQIERIDFIKIDVEGAELEVFTGAQALLGRYPRPVFMVEMQDVRTAPWGYPASILYDFLSRYGFEWFTIGSEGKLIPYPNRPCHEVNAVAIPNEGLVRLKNALPELV